MESPLILVGDWHHGGETGEGPASGRCPGAVVHLSSGGTVRLRDDSGKLADSIEQRLRDGETVLRGSLDSGSDAILPVESILYIEIDPAGALSDLGLARG